MSTKTPEHTPDQAYIDHKVLEAHPGLRTTLPILYFVWTEAILTGSEIEKVKDALLRLEWLSSKEKEYLVAWLDIDSPPQPTMLKNWRMLMKKPPTAETVQSLSEFGWQLVKSDTQANALDKNKVLADLQAIESELGIISNEFYHGFKIDTQPGKAPTTTAPSSFDIATLNELLDGQDREIIQKVKDIISTEAFTYLPGIIDKDLYRDHVLAWCKILAKEGLGAIAYPEAYGGKNDIAQYFAVMETLSYHDLSLVIKFGVQFGLFGMSVMFLGTKKHHDKYLKAIGELALPGCFAMTETGHGSNVRDIETTATYDREAREFVIHTPHEQAGKEYIGNAARHGRMATVFAQLIVEDTPYGVTAFLVPLRDEQNQTLPGIRIEDNGDKLGLNGVDNGKIWFDQVRIPSDNMLDRFAQVSPEGIYSSPITSDSKRFFTMLGTLVGGRIAIPRAGLSAAKSGLTIAIRYGERRKQFGPPGAPEQPILGYKTHQRKLMPLLANAYALHFALAYVTQRFRDRQEEDAREIEALAAGIKAYATWNTTHTLQICREACGGKGYLLENRIGILKADTDIFTTFEGDNTVLMQLVAKTRLTEFQQELQDINFFTIINYIGQQAKTKITELNPIITRKTDAEHLLDSEFHLNAFRYRERNILNSAARRLKHYLDQGMNSFEAFNECQYHLVQVAFAYIERVVLEQFVNQVNTTEDPDVQAALKKLCGLFALSQIEKNKGWYLEQNYMEGVKTKAIRREVNQLCQQVRKDALALTEAFAIPDACLAAPIAL